MRKHMTTMCQAIYLHNDAKKRRAMYTIYKYTNSVNGKVYIGQTSKTMSERAQKNGHNYSECRKFYSAIKKYGWDSFVPEVICTVETIDEANELEQRYISIYNSTNDMYGYNIALGGSNHEMSDETKRIISEKAKERYIDPMNNPMFGRAHSKESKKKQSDAKLGEKNPMFGTKWTEAQRQRSGTKGMHLNLSEEHRKALSDKARQLGKDRAKSIRCTESQVVYDSIQSAADDIGVTISTLCGHLKGRQKSCKGKHFEYVN